MNVRDDKMLIRAAVLGTCFFLQGCLPAAWVAVVGVDVARSGDVEFLPFEHSWVASDNLRRSAPGPVTSIAVVPFDGDQEMAGRFSSVLQTQTGVTVIGPAHLAGYNREQGVWADEEQRTREEARAISRELRVDGVLFGRVQTVRPPHPSDWGWSEREEKRLYLYLTDAQGALVWKDELPFTVVKGAKPPLEEAVRERLATHFMTHADKLGLGDLWLTSKKSGS